MIRFATLPLYRTMRRAAPRFAGAWAGTRGERDIQRPRKVGPIVVKVLLIILCFFLPFLAVLLHEGLTRRVLWAFLLQLLGHIPGVIYGIYVVTQD
jgi:uncharacterized membrane protein YqaE (UPF0057 family)